MRPAVNLSGYAQPEVDRSLPDPEEMFPVSSDKSSEEESGWEWMHSVRYGMLTI